MTIRQLIDILEEFDEDDEIVIGIEQTYGSNFAMSIRDINEHIITKWNGCEDKMVVITEHEQIGTVEYDEY